MPLNTNGLKTILKEKIIDALNAPIDEKSNSSEIKNQFAESLSDAISSSVDTWIKTATVTVQAGIVVVTSAGTGTTTSTGIGVIS